MLTEVNDLETTGGSTTIYAKISNGRIVVPATENEDGAKGRMNKIGNRVFEKFYGSIGGKITNLTVEENKFGDTEVRVGLQNEDKRAVLTFNLDSSYGRGFMKQIFNVDLTKMVNFTPWSKMFDEVKRTNLYLNYSDKTKVEMNFPDGTPEIKWLETKKGNVIDPVSKAEHEDFLNEKIQQFIIDNNLVFTKGGRVERPSMEDTDWDELTSPLNADEKSQLSKPKSSTSKKALTDFLTGDDFFNEL
jgi:hypothetical protein